MKKMRVKKIRKKMKINHIKLKINKINNKLLVYLMNFQINSYLKSKFIELNLSNNNKNRLGIVVNPGLNKKPQKRSKQDKIS